MDARFFTFLARQPSAKLIERSSFCGLPKRGIALILIQAIFWQPLFAQADGIVVSGSTNTRLGQAGNGVPIVNIAGPNASGLSHNQYQQYNVGSQGVILNNATHRTQITQLGGIIVGNKNLNGHAASVILNEVIGANATQLKGYTEVAGQSARVIVANPYGISCNGCGFINTPHVTLTTGKPLLDNDRLDHYRVDGGSVSIEGAGLNVDNVDQFDIITRSAKINAELHARKLNIVTGRNDVDAQTLNANALTDDGSVKPLLAIDSSALGGLYAGAIRLVGTEAGVGVRLAGNVAASGGDIQIDTNGQLITTQMAASGGVNINAASAEVRGAMYGSSIDVKTRDGLNVQQNIAARDRITLSSSGQVTNSAVVEAGVNADNSRNGAGDVTITAQDVRNSGTVAASQNLQASATKNLNNQGGTLSGQASTRVSAATLDNRHAGRFLSQGSATVSGGKILNAQGGLIASAGNLSINAGLFDNSQQGRVSSANGNLSFNAARLDNRNGEVSSQGDLLLGGVQADNSNGGRLLANGAFSLTYDGLSNGNNGVISGQQSVSLNLGHLFNGAQGSVYAKGNLDLTAVDAVDNAQGTLRSDAMLTLRAGSVRNHSSSLNNAGGQISADQHLTLAVSGAVDNRGGRVSTRNLLTLRSDTFDNRAGVVRADKDIQLLIGSLDNTAGKVSSAGALKLVSAESVANQQGSISTDGELNLTSTSLDNSHQGWLSGKGATVVNTGTFDNSHHGQLTSAERLTLTATQVTNQDGGRIAAAKDLIASVTGLDQRGGEFYSKTTLSLDLNHGQLNNQNGLINAPDALLLKNLAGVDNQAGEISSSQGFTFNADSLDNSNGKLLSDQALIVRVAKTLSNVKGALSAASIDVSAASLDNTQGLLSSRGAFTLSVNDGLINRNARLVADGKLLLSAGSVDNSAGQVVGKQDLIANIGGLQQQGGQLVASGRLSLTGATLDNSHNGLLSANGPLTLNVGSVDNRGGEVSSQDDISLAAQRLDNSDSGRVISQKGLALKVDQLLNSSLGGLSGKDSLTLTGASLDNSGGSLLSQQTIDLGLSGDLINRAGSLKSEGLLSVRSASLINDAGSLSSAGALTLTSTKDVSNRGGKLVTDGRLDLTSARLDNSQSGNISGKGPVSINTGDFDNSHNGSVSSADTLTLTAAQLSNGDGGSIGSGQALVVSVAGLQQQGGKLFSHNSLTLDLNGGQLNNQNGLINAPGILLLNNLAAVNNQAGEISSAQGFTITADSLDNRSGKLLSDQALIVRVAQALTNVKGMIAAASLDPRAGSLDNDAGNLTSRSDLTLNVSGVLSNQSNGLINAANRLDATSLDLDNRGGQMQGGSALSLRAGSIDNRASGLINSKGTLLLAATSLDASEGGEVSATGAMDLSLSNLVQRGGRLLADDTLVLKLNGGDLNNQQGLIRAKGLLTFDGLRDLNNQSGEISSSQHFSLNGRNLDNRNGKLISSQQLALNASSLLNQAGLISGWEGLSVSGDSLDNRYDGKLSSRDGDVSVILTGALLNGDKGTLVSQNTLKVSAASVDNRGGILSSGAGQTYSVSGLLDNSQKGLIDSGAALILNAQRLGNATGTINARQNVTFTGVHLDNSAGSLSGKTVTLDLLGTLTNTSGKLASAGELLITRANQIDNQGGELVSQSALSLFTVGLDNSHRGTVAANAPLRINATGLVQNSNDGLIYSKDANLRLEAGSLGNDRGTLQSQGALDLLVSNDIDNQSGKIIAQAGNLSVTANTVDNRGGTLSSLQDAFTARLTGTLRNGYDTHRQGGITQAQVLDISATAGLDNYGGRVSAQSGDALINTGGDSFDNRNGSLHAKHRVSVSGNNFDNGGDNDGDNNGRITGRQIDLNLAGALNNRLGTFESGSSLDIAAANLDNQTGTLRALGTHGVTRFQIGGLFDNRNGTLETANTDLALGVGGLLNGGGNILHVGHGSFGIATTDVMNAGGSLVTRGVLNLNADSWTNTSVLQAGTLNVNVNNLTQTADGQLLASNAFVGTGSNWTNDGLIASDGTMSLSLGGTYAGDGRLSSLGNLALRSGQISLGSIGSLAGGGRTDINVGGALTNHGRVISNNDLFVSAGGISNYGTQSAAQSLTVNTPSLMNTQGLIFSGVDMQLNTASLTNLKGDFYSLRNLTIGGNGAAHADRVSNISGSMESSGLFAMSANAFENRTEGSDGAQNFAVGRTLVKGFIAVQCLDCSGDTYSVNYIARETFAGGTDSDNSASALLTAGGDFTFTGSSFLNSQSTVSAGGNISIQADSFKNIGAIGGTIERTRTYVYPQGGVTDGTVKRFMPKVVAYNQRNNPDFPNVYYVNTDGDLRPGTPYLAIDPYRDSKGDPTKFRYPAVKDTETGAVVGSRRYPATLTGYLGGTTSGSQYDSANLMQLPAALTDLKLISDVEVAKDGTGNAGRSAVIQAGGKVSINATQDLQNSVIHEDYISARGTHKVPDTIVNGIGLSVVVRLNAQLPPDLAQQQINPLTLPGFSLPTGQNGLFRLSGQAGSTTASTQIRIAPQSWSMSAGSLLATQRDQAIPSIRISDIRIASLHQAATATQRVTRTKALNTSAPADAVNDGLYEVSITRVPGIATAQVLTPTLTSQQLITTQRIDRVRGLPATTGTPSANKYLIETNPVLTDLKQFMSSDYLLAGLGHNPDASAKRLGDGFYEQRLVQQAITARTGQAFIDGQISNQDQFKHLMNNAIASKDALDLAVGVSLTAEQIAALTHDIVWLEKHEVNGEKVLVPVLYLAQANNRLAPNGALIAGKDVTLIAGQNLDNVGTLKATHNLSASAGQNLVNSGLINAGNRLDLLTASDVFNTAGGIIAGRDISVTAINGDVINERTISSLDSEVHGTLHKDYADSAARIEAANNLSVLAGRDINNLGSVLQAGRDLTLNAGRDTNIASAQVTDSLVLDRRHSRSDITQIGATVSADRDLSVQAGRDVNAIASQIDANRDIAIAATRDVSFRSAADEDHSYAISKKTTSKERHVRQVSSSITAGGDVALKAGNDLEIVASTIKAKGDISLDAGQDIHVTSAKDEDYSYHRKRKNGSFGRNSNRETESYSAGNVASVISAGHDLTINASQDTEGGVSINGGRNVTVTGSLLSAGDDLLVGAIGDVSIVSASEANGTSSKKIKSGLFGGNKSGKSQVQTTEIPVGSELQAGNDAVIVAGRDVSLKASTLTAGRDTELHAGLVDDSGDINLATTNDSVSSHSESYKSKAGLAFGGGSDGIGLSLKASNKRGHEASSSSGVGSQVVAGRDAILGSTRDINIVGSAVDAQKTTELNAGRDVNVIAGTHSRESAGWKSKKDSGLSISWDRNGVTGFIGNTTNSNTSKSGSKTAAASSVSGGNVVVSAGRDIGVRGSEIYANNDIDLKAGRDTRIDAAAESRSQGSSHGVTTNGISSTISHNYGNTVDALKDLGKGDDAVSKVSSVLKAADSLDQFFRGPTLDGSAGDKERSNSLTDSLISRRSSHINAGDDISMIAGNNADIRGSSLKAGRDLTVKGRDVTIDMAAGAETLAGQQNQRKSGFVGGTSGGFKVGIGGSSGAANQSTSQGTSGQARLHAGRDINLDASNDLSLTGARAEADRNSNLKAGNDLTVRAAQNDSSSRNSRHSGGGEVGLTAGQGGIGVYASVNLGRGNLNREAGKQQEAYLYAGKTLGFASGRDTHIAGATLRGDQVIGNVGRNLTLSSVPDTGNVSGKEYDASATVTVGYGGSVSGSVGYGQTDGNTQWVGNQSSITAKDRLDIWTGQHTQLDGAVIASDSGNLKLDTATFDFTDIAGKDKEHGYYLKAGGTYGWGVGSSSAQDTSQVGQGKEGENGWSLAGYNYSKDREQIVRATVGEGVIAVRDDVKAGTDSTAGLNRDLGKAYEITRDDQHRTDLYVTNSSVDTVSHPLETVQGFKDAALNYYNVTQGRAEEVITASQMIWGEIQAQRVPLETIPEAARKILGDQRALDIGKNLVRAGLDPELLDTLSPSFANQLNGWADCAVGTCPEGVMSAGGSGHLAGATMVLPPVEVQGSTPVMAMFLTQTSNLIQEINQLPVQQAQVAILAMQAAMGPAKVTLSVAVNALIHLTIGEEYDALKEKLAVTLTATLTESEREQIQAAHDSAKEAYAAADQPHYRLNGDEQVLAAKFLIELGVGGLHSLGGKAAGRAVSVLGGAHRETSRPIGDKLDSHHCPARGCYVNAPISSLDGPAIKMDKADHMNTASYGRSREAQAYRARQSELLREGRLSEAVQMDVNDIRSKFGSKYDSAIEEMLKYVKALNPNDFVPR